MDSRPFAYQLIQLAKKKKKRRKKYKTKGGEKRGGKNVWRGHVANSPRRSLLDRGEGGKAGWRNLRAVSRKQINAPLNAVTLLVIRMQVDSFENARSRARASRLHER